MATRHHSLGFPLQATAANHRAGHLLAGLFVVAIGGMIFHAILKASDDTMLALLGPLLVFLAVASLFAGDGSRRL
jgi:hypothetical protein